MSDPNQSVTSLSLLQRLRSSPQDAATWGEFVDRYGGMTKRWCLQWGLQEADADDVVQNVMLALAQQMQSYEYRADGRFRGWLKTIAYRAWCRFLENRRVSRLTTADDAVMRLLESVAAREDFLQHIDQECERNILEDAMGAVQGRVQPHSWEAFRRTALEQQAGAAVGDALGMSVVAVYRAKSRIQTMIREEVERLEHSTK